MIQLNPGERIYLLKRRHRVVLFSELSPIIFFFVLILISIFSLFFIKKISWPEFLLKYFPEVSNFNLRFLILFFLSIFLSILWVLIFLIVTDYFLDCWVVTNQRTIHIELAGLFNLTYSSVFHDKIQDITVTIKGFLPAIFHFGDIQIETAGEFRQFIFQQIPDPEIVKQVILEAQRDYLIEKKKEGL